MKKTVFWFNSNDRKLYGILEVPKSHNNHLVLVLHGLTNSMVDCPLIPEATTALHKAGFPTFKFDYYGSGKSEGKFKEKTFSVLYENTVDTLNYAINKLKFQKIGLWGRSLGAIMASTVCDDPHIFASVIISSTINTHKTFSFCFKNGQPYSIPMKGTGKIKGEPILPYQYFKETEWVDILQKIHLAKAKNIIIIQGTEDKTISDPNFAKEIYQLIKGKKKLIYIKGANHAYRGFQDVAVKKGVDWLMSFIR